VASVQSVIDAKDIQIIPGMGLSLGDVLKLILTYWNPDKPIYKQIKANLAAAVASNNAADICKLLTTGEEAILQALTHILVSKLNQITSALPGCTIDCSGGGPDAVNVAKTVLKISIDSFSGDGVNFGALVASLVTNIVCCAVQLGVDFAIKKIGTLRILGKLQERCTKLLSGGASTAERAIAAANSNAGYGTPPASDAQIEAAVQTMGASVQTTARQQAIAVDDQIKAIEIELMNATSGLRSQISEIQKVYRPEFQRLLAAAKKTGDQARVVQLTAGLKSIDEMEANYRQQIEVIARPYVVRIEQLGGQASEILASAGLTSTVNWKPLQVAAATAVVGAGLVVFSPVVVAVGAVALLVGLFRQA
jgi:hypothetical protein